MRKLFRKRGKFLGNESGVAAIDFAIVGSVFIVLVLGTFEFGRVLYVRNKLTHAADAVTREVLVSSSEYDSSTASEDDLLAKADDWLHDLDKAKLDVDIGDEIVDGIDYRTITLVYSMQLYVPGLTDGIQLAQFRRAPKL
jgi:TadE-like protein